MSTGRFIESIYQSNTSRLYACQVQPETLTLDIGGTLNEPAAGPVNQEVSAIMSSGNKIGMNARTARFEVTAAGTSPFEQGVILTLPILTFNVFNLLVRGVAVAYQGATLRFVGKTAERAR